MTVSLESEFEFVLKVTIMVDQKQGSESRGRYSTFATSTRRHTPQHEAGKDLRRVVGTAVDRQQLAGHEIAVLRAQENQRTQQVLRVLIALERAARDGAGARGLDVN